MRHALSPLHIIIDCFKQVKGSGKSIGIYNLACNLVRNLAKERLHSDDLRIRNSRLTVIGTKHNEADFRVEGASFVRIENYNPLSQRDCLLWELFAIQQVVKKVHGDIVVFPRGYLPLFQSGMFRTAVVIHDMIPFYYHEHHPRYFGRLHNAYIMNRLKASTRQADTVITISEVSRKDIVRYAGADPERIKVIHNGLHPVRIPEEAERRRILREYALPEEYILAVASDYPHKNLNGVLKAYAAYCAEKEEALPLVVIGTDNYPAGFVPKEVGKKIRCIRYVADNDVYDAILSQSRLMLFLSLVEGFGFPPLEAMQCGVPVVCSDRSSLPEICGDAAELVNPEDAGETGKRIAEILADETRCREMIRRGFENTGRFSWDIIARRYLDCLSEVCGR